MSSVTMPAQTMPPVSAIEAVLAKGDLSKLTEAQRVDYVLRTCESLGLNPLMQPLRFLTLDGKLVLYATKDCTEQLRKLHGVSVTDIVTQRVDDIYIVLAKVRDRTGRTDASTGAVGIGTLKGNALANAIMKAETKAKRRATLSICGLGILDESEIETIKGAAPVVTVNTPLLEAPAIEVAPASPQVPVVEAPQPEPAEPPATPKPRVFHQCRLLKVAAMRAGPVTWGIVTFTGTDEDGVIVKEIDLPTQADSRDAPLSLAEQLCQDNELLKAIHTSIGARNKREAISRFERVPKPEDVPTAAEIFGKDDVGF
jgi:hypothetical protein